MVDNGSAEPEAERLADEFGEAVEALSLPRNIGVAGGYNAAIRWARDRGAKYVLLLNNDTLVDDPLLARRLVDACGPGVFAVGPRVMEPNGRLFSAGGKLDWRTSQTGHRQADEITSPTSPYPVAWIDGSCMLVSVAAACELQGFDEVFFLYWEEVDVCVRAWRHGLPVSHRVAGDNRAREQPDRSAIPDRPPHASQRHPVHAPQRNERPECRVPAALVRLAHTALRRPPNQAPRRGPRERRNGAACARVEPSGRS